MALQQTAHGHGAGSTATTSENTPSYSTLGQLSYAPATQTTVVTTTTTTTTSFPPLLMKASRHLHDRDPKLYPLASSPTPHSVKRFCFDIGGRPTVFREADDVEQSLQEYKQRHATIQASKGTLRSVRNSGTQYTTSTVTSKVTPLPKTVPSAPPFTDANPTKRVVPPVSLAEAAEIASLHRRSKKPRPHLSRTTRTERSDPRTVTEQVTCRTSDAIGNLSPVTPDTASDIAGQRPLSKSEGVIGSGRRPLSRSRYEDSEQVEHASQPRSGVSRASVAGTSHQGTSSHHGSGYFSNMPAPARPLSDAQIGGVSATPPTAESDLEPADPSLSSSGEQPHRLPLSSINTGSQLDASLPSPSLSPITAAANLARNTGYTGLFGGDDDYDDTTDISTLDASQDKLDDSNSGSFNLQDGMLQLKHMQTRHKIGTPPNEARQGKPQLSTPTLMEIPTMIDAFDAMPMEMQTYFMYQMLRRCAKPTLHFVADVVNPTLKCDFLGVLPLELSQIVIRNLDAQSMCRAAQVSKRWRVVINSDEKAWKDLLDRDGYQLPDGEMERAVREGWGWQHPGTTGWERDISNVLCSRVECDLSPPRSSNSGFVAAYEEDSTSRPKRKSTSKHTTSQKRQKRRVTPTLRSYSQPPAWMRSLESAQGPNAHANAAALAVPNPSVGLSSLRSLHLYKSLYQRHHTIRKSWMMEDTQPQHLAFRAHDRHVVTCLQFDTDKILTGSDDTSINVYDTKTGASRRKLEGHEGGVWALQYDGDTLVSGSTDRSVRVWDIKTGKCLQIFQGHTSTVRCLVILKPTKIGTNADGTSIMMPKEDLIITGSRDSTLRVWRLPKPGDRSVFHAGPPANDHDNPYFIRALTGHHHSVRAIAAHGDTLVSGSYDSTVRVWKISTGDLVHRLQGHTQKVYSVVLDHERNRCISGSMDNLVKVWSLETGACLFNLEGHSSLVGLLDLSNERLVSAAADSTLRIWDPENGQCKSTLSAHTGAITCFQHDGQKVISGSDRTLKMWNIKTGECVRDLLTDLSGVWQVRFNERRCVAAVQRSNYTYIEVLDFGAARDGIPEDRRSRRIVVDAKGQEIEDQAVTTEAPDQETNP